MRGLRITLIAFLAGLSGAPAASPAFGDQAAGGLPSHSAVVAATPRGVAVAHDRVVELYDAATRQRLWRTDGVANPARIVSGETHLAVLDPLTNEVVVIDLARASRTSLRAHETPVDAAYAGRDLFILYRDARLLERIASDGKRSSLAVAADPAFLRSANAQIYVYGRVDGVVQEIALAPFAVRRQAVVAPFASDFEVDQRYAYLTFPHEARLRALTLGNFQLGGDMRVGAVPVDLSFASRSTVLTARTLAVADPSAKRVWLIEGAQSPTRAFARGFLRGLLGLGLFGGRKSQFETGVDRVDTSQAIWTGYDSATRTLYRFDKSKSSVVAKEIGPAAFTVIGSRLFYWRDGTLVAHGK